MRTAVDSLPRRPIPRKTVPSHLPAFPRRKCGLWRFSLWLIHPAALRGFPFSRALPPPGARRPARPSSRRALLAGEPPSPRARAGDNPEGLGALAAVRDGRVPRSDPGPGSGGAVALAGSTHLSSGFGERTARGAGERALGFSAGPGRGPRGPTPPPPPHPGAPGCSQPAAAPHGPRPSLQLVQLPRLGFDSWQLSGEAGVILEPQRDGKLSPRQVQKAADSFN